MNRTLRLSSVLLVTSACGIFTAGCSGAPPDPETQQEAKRQLRMGYDAFKKGELDSAMTCADATLRLDTNEDPGLTAKALVLRSLIYNLRKEYDRAVTEATKAIAAKKDASYAYFARARAYEWKEQYKAAVDDLTEAIALTPVGPKQVPFYEFRAKCSRVLGEEEKARDDERRARELGQ